MTELKSNFAVARSAVGVLTSYRAMIRLPPTVRRVLFCSFFCGRNVQTIQPYVTTMSSGTSVNGMKSMVLVPGMSCMPWARQPSSFAKLFIQILRYFSNLMRCQNSNVRPVSSSRIAHAKFWFESILTLCVQVCRFGMLGWPHRSHVRIRALVG